ncbi:MAG TPA: pentapeptide repeat-containing protein, partial [Thermoanaerobaculia bacterium]|nr:pentapeptide repeat-containing protein [Thermoanaerobaculia bacterium]
GADFSGTNMVRAEAEDADFSEGDFRFGQLVGAKLVGTSFQNANLTHADFSEAQLGGSSFIGASGEGAKFTGQFHLRLVLAAGSLMNTKKKVGKAVEGAREVERQARIAALERKVAERDRSVAAREGSGEKEKTQRTRSVDGSSKVSRSGLLRKK